MIDSKQFVLAGKASFTRTAPTGQHFRYRVNKKEESRTKETIWFVQVGITYQAGIYIGMLGGDQAAPQFKLTRNSRFQADVPSVKLFIDFWDATTHPEDPMAYGNTIRFQHAGRCCVCSRELTNPESIDLGIGPECRGKMGL